VVKYIKGIIMASNKEFHYTKYPIKQRKRLELVELKKKKKIPQNLVRSYIL